MKIILQTSTVRNSNADLDCTACQKCRVRDRCLPGDADPIGMQEIAAIVDHRRQVKRGAILYRMDDTFKFLYALRVGQFKVTQIDPCGAVQVLAFQLPGDLLGMDAIETRRHQSEAVAIEDSELCAIPFAALESAMSRSSNLLKRFHRLMSMEIMRDQSTMLILANMRAEQRMATFLLNLSLRHENSGLSAARFQLRMSREEIGNFLGLTRESVSRMMTGMERQGILELDNHGLEILDFIGLKSLATASGPNRKSTGVGTAIANVQV